jgi:hypothetical protein
VAPGRYHHPINPLAHPTRRRFLKAATAALAAPVVVPSCIFGADGGSVAPSDRITVGFIGCEKMANDYHLPELLRFDDVQAVVVCEVGRRAYDPRSDRVSHRRYAAPRRADPATHRSRGSEGSQNAF